MAAAANDVTRLKELIANGEPVAPQRVNPSVPRTDVFTPLMAAARAGNFGAVYVLLQAGAPPDDTFQGKTALAQTSDPIVVGPLLRAFAEPDTRAVISEAFRDNYGGNLGGESQGKRVAPARIHPFTPRTDRYTPLMAFATRGWNPGNFGGSERTFYEI